MPVQLIDTISLTESVTGVILWRHTSRISVSHQPAILPATDKTRPCHYQLPAVLYHPSMQICTRDAIRGEWIKRIWAKWAVSWLRLWLFAHKYGSFIDCLGNSYLVFFSCFPKDQSFPVTTLTYLADSITRFRLSPQSFHLAGPSNRQGA